MKKAALIIVCGLILVARAFSQAAANYLTITTTNTNEISDASGAGITGTWCAYATDTTDTPIAFLVGSTYSSVRSSVCKNVSAGQFVANPTLANPAATSPTNIRYHVTITNTVTHQITQYPGVLITVANGVTTWDWSNWSPATVSSLSLIAPTINIGTTTTLSPGASATVSNSGTPGVPILNFGIPQGLAGLGSDAHCGADGSGNLNCSTVNTPIALLKNGQALSPASPLQPLYNAPLSSRILMVSGDSTTALALGAIQAFCDRSGPGQEVDGVACAPNSTYSIDSSHNVTVNVSGSLPSNCLAGGYVSFDAQGTFQSNALNNNTGSNSAFLLASVTSTSVTFNNSASAGATGSTAANGVMTCSIVNNGSNGQTQNGFNTASGFPSLAFTEAQCPDLDIHSMGINDVRGGGTTLAQLEGYLSTYITGVRAACPKTAMLLYTPNSLLADDPTGTGLVTSPSTTTTNAVTSTGTQPITLTTMLTGISGLVTPGLSLAQEVANTQAVAPATTGSITSGSGALAVANGGGYTNGQVITVAGAGAAGAALVATISSGAGTGAWTISPTASTTVSGAVVTAATTGSITSGSATLTVAIGTGYYNGMVITVAGAGVSGATLVAQIQSGGGSTSLTIAPQAATTVSSAVVAQSPTVYSGHVLVDTGANQEIAPITAVSGSTIYPTFAQTHASGVAVIPTMATMAQAYSNIIHDAPMSFEGTYPNVQVADSQAAVFDRLVADTKPSMTNQLHPGGGYYSRSIYLTSVLNKDKLLGTAHGTVANAGLPTVSYASVTQYSPLLSLNAINANYSACWSNGYYRCVEDTRYYTNVCAGVQNGYGSGSYLRINSEVSGQQFGVCPALPGDVVEFLGYGDVQLPSNAVAGPQSTYTQISNPGVIPWTILGNIPVRVQRPLFISQADEPYARSPGYYTYHHTVSMGACGTNFCRFQFTDGANPAVGTWTTSDIFVFSNNTTLPLTTVCSSWGIQTMTPPTIQCNGTGNWAAYQGLSGKIYGTHAMEVPNLQTNSNCAVNSASPAACGAAQAGVFVVPTTTTSYTVNTALVTAHSRISLTPLSFAADLPSSPTCVAPAVTSAWTVSGITAATSFTLSLPSTTGQTCWYFTIVN